MCVLSYFINFNFSGHVALLEEKMILEVREHGIRINNFDLVLG